MKNLIQQGWDIISKYAKKDSNGNPIGTVHFNHIGHYEKCTKNCKNIQELKQICLNVLQMNEVNYWANKEFVSEFTEFTNSL